MGGRKMEFATSVNAVLDAEPIRGAILAFGAL
jgi:hypothetical protein